MIIDGHKHACDEYLKAEENMIQVKERFRLWNIDGINNYLKI